MIIVGLTGSMAMGKSTAAEMLRAMDIPVHCSDSVIHEFLAPGGLGVEPVAMAFPGARDPKNDGINRKTLRALLGDDHAKWDLLEFILHPLAQASQKKFLSAQAGAGAKLVVLDIPLLFETGAEQRVDYVAVVTASASTQRKRAFARPGMTEADFDFRLSRQTPDAEKRKRADFVIPTGFGHEVTRQALRSMVKRAIKKGGRGAYINA